VPSYTDEGIVLRRVDYGETDRILTVLTLDHGKIGVMARGARRPTSALGPRTDLFSRSRMQLAAGRGELEVLTQAVPLTITPAAGDARSVACAALCAELVDRVLESNHAEPELYGLLAAALTDCADRTRDPRVAVVWFARRMIDRLGYAPQLHDCTSCGTRLREQPARFSAAGGGLLCAECAPADPAGVECSVRVIKVLRTAAAADTALWARLRFDATTLATLERVVEEELAFHLDRRLRSFEVLRAIEGRSAAPG